MPDALPCLLLFGSTTGTTRLLAQAVRKGLEAAGLKVTLRNVRQANPKELLEHELIVAGCSTWEDGALQRDFQQFLPRLGDLRLDGHRAAVFGPGSKSYSHFCRAVDLLESDFAGRGAELIVPSLRIDGTGYSARPDAFQWARDLVARLGIGSR